MPKITIAIPTYNRAKLLTEAIESVLVQTYEDFELLISDNASTDETKNVVVSFKNPRIRYHRNKKNIGMMNNWNKCVTLSEGKYLVILGDDDKLYPNFLEKSLKAHRDHPSIGFSFAHCNKVYPKGNYLTRWGYKFTPSGYLNLFEYLQFTIKYGSCLTNSSTVLINKKVFSKVGLFETPYGTNTFDFNMWIKIALKYPVCFIDEVLCDYRIHKEQVSEMHWRRKEMPTGKIGTYLEILGAIAALSDKKEFENKEKKKFLTKRLFDINRELSALLRQVIPEL